MRNIKRLAFQLPFDKLRAPQQKRRSLSYELELLSGMSYVKECVMHRNNWRTRLRIAHHVLITGDERTTGAIYSAQVWQSDQRGWYSDLCLVCIRNPQPSGRWLISTSKPSRIRLLAAQGSTEARKQDSGIYENTFCIRRKGVRTLTARIVASMRSFRFTTLGTGRKIDQTAQPI